MTIYW